MARPGILESALRVDDAEADSLGALELLELGAAGPKPMISNRRLGQFTDVFGYFFGAVGEGVTQIAGLLTDILEVPINLVSTGVGALLTGFAGLVGEIPILGPLVSSVVLAANAIIQAALQLPLEILTAVENLGKALKTLTPDQQKTFGQIAMKLLVDNSPPEFKAAAQQKLNALPPTLTGGAEGVDWGSIAAVVLPVLATGTFLL